MQRSYESVFILAPELSEEERKSILEKFSDLISKSAALEGIDEWGKQKLAYPINYKTEGYYFLANFSCEPDFPKELERNFKITEGILKYLVIKKG
jgi:small subunit ribosomal protein S6